MEASDEENAALMEQLMRSIPPMDLRNGEKLLREAKQIFDEHGVVFFLRQGTCLGAVRDHALIPWIRRARSGLFPPAGHLPGRGERSRVDPLG